MRASHFIFKIFVTSVLLWSSTPVQADTANLTRLPNSKLIHGLEIYHSTIPVYEKADAKEKFFTLKGRYNKKGWNFYIEVNGGILRFKQTTEDFALEIPIGNSKSTLKFFAQSELGQAEDEEWEMTLKSEPKTASILEPCDVVERGLIRARIRVLKPNETEKLPLELNSQEVMVDLVRIKSNAELQLRAQIDANLLEPYQSLIHEDRLIATTAANPKKFNFVVALVEPKTEFDLMIIGVRGDVRKLTAEITYDPQDSKYIDAAIEKSWRLTLSFGLTFQNYIESFVGSLDIVGMTARIKGSQYLSRDFEVGGAIAVLAFPLSTSDTARSTRTFSLEGYGDFSTSWLAHPWTLRVRGGYFYATMLVSPSDHGYGAVNGPRLYPILERQIGKGIGHVYLSYSPILALSFGSREISGGIGYRLPINDRSSVVIELDISNLEFSLVDPAGLTRNISSTSYTLAGGYRF